MWDDTEHKDPPPLMSPSPGPNRRSNQFVELVMTTYDTYPEAVITLKPDQAGVGWIMEWSGLKSPPPKGTKKQ